MQTIKTFVVIALLMAVCYGAFKALNSPDISIPEELEQWANSSGDQLLDDFQIPEFTVPDSFAVESSSVGQSGEGLAPSAELPSFPEFDGRTPGVDQAAMAGVQRSDSGRQDNTANANPTVPNDPEDIWNLPAISSAQLTSAPTGANAASGGQRSNAEGREGPAIPFVAQAPADQSLANDLINAGGLPLNPGGDFSEWSPQLLAANEISGASNSSSDSAQLPPLALAKKQALEKAQMGNLAEALEMMSQYYERVELDYAEHTDLVDLLDALSREVIYSDRHLLGPPHQVSSQDTLQNVAEKNRINPELLAAINKLGDSQALVPNSTIKVIEGPFRAQVSLSRGELTLFLRKMYAGRFPVSISSINQPPQGTFEIVDRRRDRTYYGTNVVIPAAAPTNPFGGYWLSLGSNLSIHGSPEQITSDLEGAGCISLAPLDAADVYRILGKGASVEILP
jgi:hypothetical protein